MSDSEKMEKRGKGLVAHREKFKVEVHYSDKATEKELIKFTMKKGKSFEISAKDLVNLIIPNFNKKLMAPLIVENNTIHMTEVTRVLHGILEKDMKKGDPITIPYKHFIPYQFAVCEESLQLAKITRPIKTITITPAEFEKAKESIDKKVKDFVELQYEEVFDRMKQVSVSPDSQ